MLTRKSTGQTLKTQSLQEECNTFSSHLHVHHGGRRAIVIEPGAANNRRVIVKQITKFNGRRADEFLEWDSKLCASLSVYNKTIFNVLQ